MCTPIVTYHNFFYEALVFLCPVEWPTVVLSRILKGTVHRRDRTPYPLYASQEMRYAHRMMELVFSFLRSTSSFARPHSSHPIPQVA
jgi:hypothetical protein